MSNVLDRRIEHFQHKVQQNITLADDEIQRLAQDLQALQGEISEVKDQLGRVNVQLNQSEQAAKGKYQRELAKSRLKVSQVKIQNENRIKEIIEKHRVDMEALQNDYQNSLAQLSVWATKREQQRTAQLDIAMKQIEDQTNDMKNTISTVERTAVDAAGAEVEELQKIEYSRMSRLERSVKAKNEERLAALLSAKARLSDCVATLEEMERNHSLTMSSYQGKLNALDSNYQQRVKRMQELSAREIENLKRKLQETKRRDESMRDQIDQIQHNQKRQMFSAVREGEELRIQMQSVGAEAAQANEDEEKAAQQMMYDKLKKKLADRENQLIKARTENESMKRELSRLQHEARKKNMRRTTRI